MKRLILAYLLSLFVIASCDSPMNNMTSNQQSSAPDITSEIPSDAPPAKADSIRKAIWQQFKDQNGSQWQVRWNKRTGLPVSIFSGLTEKKYPGRARQAARAFLAEHGTLFGFQNLNGLQHVKTQTNRGVRHVTFNQAVKGVPVYEAEYKVHLRPDGRVDMANGTYYPNIEVSTNPSISKSGAIEAARSDFELPQGAELQTRAELVIYPTEKQFRLAWKLILFSEKPVTDWFFMVDARSGEILEKLNRLTDVTGDGNVYPTHPGLSSVTNKPLYGLIGNGYLDGTYVDVQNASASDAYSSSHSFQYSTSNTHFDEVSLYYHVDNFRRNFVEALDAGNNLFNKLNATAHDNSTCPNNACFSPSTQDIYFSDSYPFAKEDKVVHHEYGHAVIYDIQSGIQSSSNEEGAISEGTPDYFAGTFTNRSRILEYSVPFAERDMANPDIGSYNEYQNIENTEGSVPPHNGGEFFSAILWDLRGKMSATDVDFLVYDALYRITGGPNFLEFRDAMMAADDAAYGGSHNDLIQDTFAARG